MTRIVIAGAGGFGRGVYSWLASSPRHLDEFNVCDIVYIDDSEPDQPTHGEIIGRISDYQPTAKDRILCAIGSPNTRQQVTQMLKARRASFHTFVDDRAILGQGTVVEEGAIICPGVVISADAHIGKHVHINFNCSVGHDTKIGAYATLSPMVDVMGQVTIGDSAFLGGSCTVLPRTSIGSNSILGAGAVIVNSVGNGVTMVGNPARAVKQRTTDDHPQ